MLITCLTYLCWQFPWPVSNGNQTIASLPVPDGYERVVVGQDSFAAWLRSLPLKSGKKPLLLYNGKEKRNQNAHHAILDIDVGTKDLQQCADAVMRLRAEYLFSRNAPISFNFTSGDAARWEDWRQGKRPQVKGNVVRWMDRADEDASYANFKRYLQTVYLYAGTFSLRKELEKIPDPAKIQAGDVLIQGGFPGHAMLVVDVAENADGKRAFLLTQSYMPAQEIHVVRGPLAKAWYPAKSSGALDTPEWTFAYKDFHRFPQSQYR